jgi:1,4-alpha-glucan branching enzyme
MPKTISFENAKSGNGNGKNQTFSFTAPMAMRVQLAGDFTHWQQRPIAMHKGQDGIWRTTVELSPGKHHYRFLVDGQWQDDPECTLRVPNPYGSEDAVRQVA